MLVTSVAGPMEALWTSEVSSDVASALLESPWLPGAVGEGDVGGFKFS